MPAGPAFDHILVFNPTSSGGPAYDHAVGVIPDETAGPAFDHIVEVIPTFSGGPAYDHVPADPIRGKTTGPTFSGMARALAIRGIGPTFQGDAEETRVRGVGPTFQTRASIAVPVYSSPTGGQIPPITVRGFGPPTDGRAAVTVRGFGGLTGGRATSIIPPRRFGGTTGGVVVGLPTPINLTATVIDAGCIRLDWVDPGPEEDGYRLERSLENANDWEVIATLPADTITFVDRFAVPLVVYDYRAISFDVDRTSLPSNIATAVTPLPPDIATGAPPTTPVDPPRSRIEPDNVEFLSPGTYGLEKDEEGDVTGFKF